MTHHFEARDARRIFRSASGATVRALDGVSVEVPQGAFLAVTGPSGGGKTTLLALLAALDRPTSGTILFGGADLNEASESERTRLRRRFGIVFQQTHMLRGLPLWENVTYPLVPRGTPPIERRRIASALLERVGLKGREASSPEELSGGEGQRAGVARALAGDPEALLADEPTSDLDRDSAASVVALFQEFHASGRTVIVATHDESFLGLATHRCRLRNGRLE